MSQIYVHPIGGGQYVVAERKKNGAFRTMSRPLDKEKADLERQRITGDFTATDIARSSIMLDAFVDMAIGGFDTKSDEKRLLAALQKAGAGQDHIDSARKFAAEVKAGISVRR